MPSPTSLQLLLSRTLSFTIRNLVLKRSSCEEGGWVIEAPNGRYRYDPSTGSLFDAEGRVNLEDMVYVNPNDSVPAELRAATEFTLGQALRHFGAEWETVSRELEADAVAPRPSPTLSLHHRIQEHLRSIGYRMVPHPDRLDLKVALLLAAESVQDVAREQCLALYQELETTP